MRSAIGKYGAILVKPFASCGTSHPLGIIDGMQAAESSAVDGMAAVDDTDSAGPLKLPSIDAMPTELVGVDPNVLLVDVGVVVLELCRRRSTGGLTDEDGAQFARALTSLATTARRTPNADLARGFISFMVANRSTVQ